MKHLIIACTVAALLLAATGCAKSDAPAGSTRYLYVTPSKVAFIQWRSTSGGHLHGTITEDSIGGSGSGQTLSVSSAPFTGIMRGNSVKLTFAVWYFLQAQAHGTFSGSALSMVVPQSDGTVKMAKFSPSDNATYHRAVAKLRARITHAAGLAAGQQDGRSIHAQTEKSAQSALTTLYNDSSLAPGGKFFASLTRLVNAVHLARSHLTKELRDASGDNSYCVAAYAATGDSQAVGGALQNGQGAISALTADVLVVRHDVAIATAYLRHLSRSGLTAPSRASEVVATGNASVQRTVAMANAYIDEINAIQAHAVSLADNLSTRKCSSARSGKLLHPIPHIGSLPVGRRVGCARCDQA